MVRRFLKLTILLSALSFASAVCGNSPNETATPIATPSIPAGPRPTATVTPLQETPQPTRTCDAVAKRVARRHPAANDEHNRAQPDAALK